jgi:hypothetical protein
MKVGEKPGLQAPQNTANLVLVVIVSVAIILSDDYPSVELRLITPSPQLRGNVYY